jgi:hypothetical protein
MTDQQRLRDALASAVPDPPDEPARGASARGRARATRRRQTIVAGGIAVAVVAASAGFWNVSRHDAAPPVTGTGRDACRQLLHDEPGGRYIDSRIVDGTIAAAWLGQVAPDVDSEQYRDDHRVTICLVSRSPVYATFIVDETGHHDRVTSGGFQGPGGAEQAMAELDRLTTSGRATTDEPFACPVPSPQQHQDVTPSLPTGATAAKICFDGEFFTPRATLTQNVDTLVRAVNAAPIEYVLPHFNCSGAEGDYDFTLVFRYPSGTRHVSEETCVGLVLGRFTRAPRVSLDPLYRSLLVKQIGTGEGPPFAPPCTKVLADRPQGVGDIREIIAARYCPTRTGGAGTVLTVGQIRQLRTWGRIYLGATTQPDNPTRKCTRPATGWPRLSLADAWGNYFTVVLVGCGRRIFPEAVDWGARDKVIYPLGYEEHTLARLAQGLALESP